MAGGFMLNLRSRRTAWAARISAAAVLTLGVASLARASQASAGPKAQGPSCSSPSVSKQFFGTAYDLYAKKNLPVYRYSLANCRGEQVRILTYGGIIQSIRVPGRGGKEADIVLGFKTLQDYITYDSPPVTANGGPYFGETIGRFGNRIAKGTFKLNGQTYTLPINNGVNALHGGLVGFGNHIWASQEVTSPGSVGVQLTLVSPNGDASGAAGSPGCVAACSGYPA